MHLGSHHRSGHFSVLVPGLPHLFAKLKAQRGQVAQSVERSPEKAGVGGSIPSLATMFSRTYRHQVHLKLRGDLWDLHHY